MRTGSKFPGLKEFAAVAFGSPSPSGQRRVERPPAVIRGSEPAACLRRQL